MPTRGHAPRLTDILEWHVFGPHTTKSDISVDRQDGQGEEHERWRVRVLVIGGTRFIGPRVVPRLVSDGHEVGVFYRGLHDAPLPESVRRFTSSGAAMPVTMIPDELRAYEPDVVLHMIAMGVRDAEAAREAFAGVAQRIVAVSSGDVYRAYGVFRGCETGGIEPMPLSESSPLRSTLYPYRAADTPVDALEYYYDKILMEREICADPRLPATILRLPKVYGPGDNGNLATVYGFRDHPGWHWTHGYVENVAAAIALAIVDERAAGQTYNVGEAFTPSVAQRLAYLPPNPDVATIHEAANFAQDIVYDTSRIRRELGYEEEIAERDAMYRVAAASRESAETHA
jgi:nucleoside-diphosphate-sugar epimerase